MPMVDNLILEAKDLVIGYGKGKKRRVVADQINLGLKKGELHCLLGPNGVGKSTLMKTIVGFLPPFSGKLELDERRVSHYSPQQLSKKVSLVLTDRGFPGNLTVGQLVSLGRIPHTGWMGNLAKEDWDVIQNAILQTEVSAIRDSRLSTLSDGQIQKAMIARALAQDGEMMILDEPTAHLDLVNRLEIMVLLRNLALRKNKAILVITHDLEISLEIADKLWLMLHNEPMIGGSPEDLAIQESLNLLLPGEKYRFNRHTGKIEPQVDFEYPAINGPEELVQWVKLALRKHRIRIREATITVCEKPFEIRLEGDDHPKSWDTITEMVEFLKNHRKQ